MNTSCHLCGATTLLALLDFGKHPIAHHLLVDLLQEETVHPVRLFICESCGLIQLADPIPADKLYTNYYLSSWKLNPNVPRLLQLIEQLPGLDRNSIVVEVGSNDGSFLEMLKSRGYKHLTGVEPAVDAQEAARQRNVDTVSAYFSPEIAKELVSRLGRCDLFISRQVLEHITELRSFKEALGMLVRPGGYVVIEVPNFEFSLDSYDYSAIWEEHVNYFTLPTLTRFLADSGIRLIHSEVVSFSGETLVVVGKYVGGDALPLPDKYLAGLRAKALAYRDHWPIFRNALIQYLSEHQKRGEKVAVYGAGCRACSLINFSDLGSHLEFVVDDQLEKQDKYMPGSRLPILPGEALENNSIALCVLAVNAENEEKVIAMHPAFTAGGGQFASLLPPSDRLLLIWSRS